MNTRKTFALAGALAGSLTAALLLSTAGAMAAPYDGHGNDRHAATQQHDRDGHGDRFDKSRVRYESYDRARYRDRDHRPPLRVEFAGRAPHAGMAFHQGHWIWSGNQWVWIAGAWLTVAIR